MVDYEFMIEDVRQTNETKLLTQKEKEVKMLLEKMKHQDEIEKNNKKKEQERILKIKLEEEEIERKIQDQKEFVYNSYKYLGH